MSYREPPRRRRYDEDRRYSERRVHPSEQRRRRMNYDEEEEAWEDNYYPPRRPVRRMYDDAYRGPSNGRPRPTQQARQRRHIQDDWEERYQYTERRPQRPVYSSRIQQNKPPENQTKKGSKVVFSLMYNLLFYTLTIGILLSAMMFAFSSKSNLSIFGYRFYTVLTDSMVPQEDSLPGGFYSGDLVLVQMVDSDKVQEGDIVTFSVGDGTHYLTHRVVDRLDELSGEPGDYIVTKGDANQTNDPPIEADRVIGKVVVAIPKLGSLLEFVRENIVLCALFILSIFGFFLVLRAYLFGEEKQSSKRKASQMSY